VTRAHRGGALPSFVPTTVPACDRLRAGGRARAGPACVGLRIV